MKQTVVLFGTEVSEDYRQFLVENDLTVLLIDRLDHISHCDKCSTFDVVSFHEFYQVRTEEFRRHNDLPYRSVEAVRILTDKSLSKRLSSFTIYSPPYVFAPTEYSFSEFVTSVEASVGYPCVVKPSNGLYSAGVVRANNVAQLYEAYSEAKTVTLAIKGKRSSGQLIAERYVDGEEYMIDGFKIRGEIIYLLIHVKKPDLCGPYFHETGCISRGIEEDEFFFEKQIIAEVPPPPKRGAHSKR